VPGTPDFRSRRRGSFVRRCGKAVGLLNAELEAPSSRTTDRERLRLLRRDAPFRQSTGRIYMHRQGAALGLALSDLFHVALSMPSMVFLPVVMAAYTTVMIMYACIYLFVDGPSVECGIAPLGRRPTFYHAFAFSMETLTTIGYGVPFGGNFFEETCAGVLVVVYFEAVMFIILNASIVGVLFARVAAANRRASQIIFSDKAVVRCVRNRFYFMLQVDSTRCPTPPRKESASRTPCGAARRINTRAAPRRRRSARVASRPPPRPRMPPPRPRMPPPRPRMPPPRPRMPPPRQGTDLRRARGCRWEKPPSSRITRWWRRTCACMRCCTRRRARKGASSAPPAPPTRPIAPSSRHALCGSPTPMTSLAA
jgi:hypothetical protein